MLAGRRIAVVEDDEIMGSSLVQRLELEGAETAWWTSAEEALAGLSRALESFDAVICDIRLPDRDGESVFRVLSASEPPPPFLFLTGHGDIDQAVRLLRAGAADYMTKPFEMAILLDRLAALVPPAADIGGERRLGVSRAMERLQALLARVAVTNLPVLITGETGVGKEVAARMLHALSPAADQPFMAVNCAAIPAELIESELFGHERGAFSGAHVRHDGFAARAGGGTLFLDEIGDMPLVLQTKLLRLIEDGTFFRVGGERPVAFRARVVSATHSALHEAIEGGRFRSDLFYRLNAVTVAIPPLRERSEDTVWLMKRFFDDARAEGGNGVRAIGAMAEEAVREHRWPGNARELRNRVRRAVALARGPMLTPGDLFPETESADHKGFPPLAAVREEAERRQIRRALEETGGRVAEAARLLQVSRTTLWEKMQRHRL